MAVYTTTQYMGLRSTMDYAVHVTTRYIQLRSAWDYAVHGTTRYMRLRSTLQLWNRAWISYPGQFYDNSTLKLVLIYIFVLFSLVRLFVSPGPGRAVRKQLDDRP
jgi:hypothetical protein